MFIPDPATATKEGKKFVVPPTFFVDTKIIIFLNRVQKNRANSQKNSILYPKNRNMGLRSGIRKKPIPVPGSRGRKPGSLIRIRKRCVQVTLSDPHSYIPPSFLLFPVPIPIDIEMISSHKFYQMSNLKYLLSLNTPPPPHLYILASILFLLLFTAAQLRM
jgi:hypothetical protein